MVPKDLGKKPIEINKVLLLWLVIGMMKLSLANKALVALEVDHEVTHVGVDQRMPAVVDAIDLEVLGNSVMGQAKDDIMVTIVDAAK